MEKVVIIGTIFFILVLGACQTLFGDFVHKWGGTPQVRQKTGIFGPKTLFLALFGPI